ncbi:Ku protein [Candidatus Dependentiae bacterium]|nr:Ku protein [Candidatus Dependentiae bacterium]
MKIVWKGTLSFGLVNININLYTAIKEHVLGFKLLHEKCHTPIQYEKYCPHCKKEVTWNEVVKGIQLKNGTYFILTQENLKKLKPEKTDSITILQFVPTEEIPPIYFENHYYIVPGKLGERAYGLLQAILKESKKTAICKFVMRDKEYLCAVDSYKNGLLLSTLHFEQEVLKIEPFESLKPVKAEKSEITLAKQLINKLSKTKFNIDQYKDEFVEKVRKKLKEKKVVEKGPKKKEKVYPRIKTPTLAESLKASLRKGSHVNGQARARR